MSSSGGVFSTTLQSITTTKLLELSKKRSHFEDQKASLLAAAGRESDQREKLRVLLHGVKQLFATQSLKRKLGDESGGYSHAVDKPGDNGLEVLLQNLGRFLELASYDPSIAPKLLQNWETSLTNQLQIQSQKYRYATLYGELVMEWLSLGTAASTGAESEDLEQPGSIHEDESRARQAGRTDWERLAFEPFETDQVAITNYLQQLFGDRGENRQAIKALEVLRNKVGAFDPGQVSEHVLRWVIKGLIDSNLLSAEKSAALKDFLANSVILTEISDVLNLRLASLSTWSWDTDGLPVEQRRQVTGKYHIFIEEDLLQAIFLHFVGVKWSVFFKRALTEFSNSEGAWASLRQPIPMIDKKRREYFLGKQCKKQSLQSRRQAFYKSVYFVSKLPDFEHESHSELDGEMEAGFSMDEDQGSSAKFAGMPRARMQSMAVQMAMNVPVESEYDLLSDHEKPGSPMAAKQLLLHTLSTEILVNTRLHGEFTCTRSEFESWDPSLPHSTVYSVFSFFGLPDKWLEFFRRFLECPLKFLDGTPSPQPRIRKRGTPGSHALSAVFGEVILFCLDYAVNQSTDGAQLHRMHDDFWFWSSSQQTVVKSWEAITTFSDIMGVSLNKGKSGAARIVQNKSEPRAVDPSLPKGDIRWGFLRLDPVSGRFAIDQDMINNHIKQLQRQLHGRKSVFDWIQAWNAFAGTFFTTNLGKPANCFGQEHVNSMLLSLESVQRRVFAETSVVKYLKNTIETRFGISDIPDGYLYFPTRLGGLELHNPFVGLVQLRNTVCENPEGVLDKFIDAELDEYHRLKVNFEKGHVYRKNTDAPDFIPSDGGHEFMSFEEFTRYREEFDGRYQGNIREVYDNLLQQPTQESLDTSASDQLLLRTHGMEGEYWQWVAKIYGEDMIERFGGLNIVDRELLPTSMISLYLSGRVKWQG